MIIITKFHTSNKDIIENVKMVVRDANNIIMAASGEKSKWVQKELPSNIEKGTRTRFNKTIINHPHTAILSALLSNDLQDEEVLDMNTREYIDYLKTVSAIVWDNIEIVEDIDISELLNDN